jgi:transaldolase
MDRLDALRTAGVSIWLDTLSRDLLQSGEFERLVRESHVSGATSNPAIFAEAITSSNCYDDQLRRLAASGTRDPRELFFTIALDDIRNAADALANTYLSTGGADGFVSFECTPDLAHDTDATIAQAQELWRRLDRPNVMIKVPATSAGVPAIEALTAEGLNINVTLLFGLERYAEVINAYIAGLERREAARRDYTSVSSVASFFVSRVDTKVDAVLPAESPLRGRVGIANARVAYERFRSTFSSSRWLELQRRGARPQRPLWASTGTKNPEYSDVLYVEELIGPDVVNTMPLKTLRAFQDHGTVERTVDAHHADAESVLRDTAAAEVDLSEITTALEHEGVRSFCDAYDRLLGCISEKVAPLGYEVRGAV